MSRALLQDQLLCLVVDPIPFILVKAFTPKIVICHFTILNFSSLLDHLNQHTKKKKKSCSRSHLLTKNLHNPFLFGVQVEHISPLFIENSVYVHPLNFLNITFSPKPTHIKPFISLSLKLLSSRWTQPVLWQKRTIINNPSSFYLIS